MKISMCLGGYVSVSNKSMLKIIIIWKYLEKTESYLQKAHKDF